MNSFEKHQKQIQINAMTTNHRLLSSLLYILRLEKLEVAVSNLNAGKMRQKFEVAAQLGRH